MTPEIVALIAACVGFAAGGGLILWLKSRPTTTKAHALKLLAKEAELLAMMPGAAQDKALAEQEMATEALAAQTLSVALAKLNAPQS